MVVLSVGVPGLVPSMAGQKTLRETPNRTASQKLSTTKGNQWKGVVSRRQGEESNGTQPNSEKRRAVCLPLITKSGQQIRNTNSPGNTAVPNGPNVDERLRLARERREEREKQLVSRELGWLEREEKARRFHERQLEERRRRLQEQRQREDNRRLAVEEKRRQTMREERERYESAVRKTMEKSQRAKQKLSQNSRGRKLTKNSVPRRLPLSPWEKSLVNRLLTPTCSYLARSKSAGCQPPEIVSCQSMNANQAAPKVQNHSGPAVHRTTASPGPGRTSHRTINLAQMKAGQTQMKAGQRPLRCGGPLQTANANVRPAINAANKARSLSRSVIRTLIPKQTELPTVAEEDVSVASQPLHPGTSQPIPTPAAHHHEPLGDSAAVDPHPTLSEHPSVTTLRAEAADTPPPGVTTRPAAGTTDPEEASRLLAEKRREARLRREREEEERLKREEAERRGREELERRRAEERARLEKEAQRLEEERRRREEEEQEQAEAEQARKAMEEAALLQKQREEELALLEQKAEEQRQERQRVFQQEEAERQARKKRLDEIMKRTRKPNLADRKSEGLEREAQPKENTEPVVNGTKEDVMKLGVGTRPSQLGLANVEDMVPIVAFKERRSLRTLSGLEEIQTHQRAEVI